MFYRKVHLLASFFRAVFVGSLTSIGWLLLIVFIIIFITAFLLLKTQTTSLEDKRRHMTVQTVWRKT